MHKLSLYLNDSQYEKLEVLQEDSPFASPEEFANEVFYTALLARWCKYKADGIQELLDSGNYEEETERFVLDGTEYEVWCDGEFAVISAGDRDVCSYQLIEGKLHYVLVNGTRVRCSEDHQREIERALEHAGYTLKDFTNDELEEELLIISSTQKG